MTRVMYDSTNAADLPVGGDLYAGYVAGSYVNYDKVKARFPDVPVVSISPSSRVAADVLDVERGDSTPLLAPGWCTWMRRLGRTPTVYTPLSSWAACRREFERQHVAEPSWWIARYDNVATLLPGTVAKQYGGNVPGHYDISVVADHWPGIDPEDGGLVRTYKAVPVPAPDANGRQMVSIPELEFDKVSSVQIKANDNGTPVRAVVQPFSYLGVLVVTFVSLTAGPVTPGLVGLVIEHR